MVVSLNNTQNMFHTCEQHIIDELNNKATTAVCWICQNNLNTKFWWAQWGDWGCWAPEHKLQCRR